MPMLFRAAYPLYIVSYILACPCYNRLVLYRIVLQRDIFTQSVRPALLILEYEDEIMLYLNFVAKTNFPSMQIVGVKRSVL